MSIESEQGSPPKRQVDPNTSYRVAIGVVVVITLLGWYLVSSTPPSRLRDASALLAGLLSLLLVWQILPKKKH
jgi:hypothetical protein